MITRRRILTILAGAAVLPVLGTKSNAAQWQGVALGAKAQIVLDHPNAKRLLAQAVAEIDRLEGLFSLHRDSQLTQLNSAGVLPDPALEMVQLLSICGGINARTNGAFDPSIQPLWALYAQNSAAGKKPTQDEITATRAKTGWQHVRVSPREVSFAKTGMQLTLNGIAQGYIADRVAALFRANGVANVMINTGEIMALGTAPSGADWTVRLGNAKGPRQTLNNAAVATSAPLGTSFDQDGKIGHIIDPRTGKPGGLWPQISVIARSAAEADGLSTAFCLMGKDDIETARGNADYRIL